MASPSQTKWNFIGSTWPAQDQEVWVRLENAYIPPFKTVFDTETLTFTPTTIYPDPHPLIAIPWYHVTMWKVITP